MSDLSLQLQQAASQLPVSAYFDEALYAREMQNLFSRGPRYVGHRLAVPEMGNFHTLPQEHQGRALVHTPKGVELISNVCRHRQALILQDRGQLDNQAGGNIVCPLHRWTYAASDPRTTGTLIGAPHFDQDPCLNLHNYPLTEWNGLLFEKNADGTGRDVAADMAELGPAGRPRLQRLHARPRRAARVQLQLEDLHRGLPRGLPRRPVPSGPGQFRHLRRPALGVQPQLFGADGGRGQPPGPRGQPGLPEVAGAAAQVPRRQAAEVRRHLAHLLPARDDRVVSARAHGVDAAPGEPTKTLNMVEFFYPEEIVAFEREFVEAQQAAYMETCVEDDEIAERMDAGRRALMLRGDNETGPYQSPMEDGMQQFHEWYRTAMQNAA
jgi:choline monooxygenase